MNRSILVAADGEAAEAVGSRDWASTPLGPIESWPQSLRSPVSLILDSPLAMIVLWGPELIQIYNDGYRVILNGLHPRAMGQRTQECWPEVWNFNAPIYEAVFRGECRSFVDQKLTILRTGMAEDAWFDLTYSPLRKEDNSVGGVLVTVVEVTKRHKSDAALHESETLRGVALAGGRMGAWRWNLDAELIWGDARFWEMWGAAPSEDPRPLSFFNERISLESRAVVGAIVTSAIQQGEEFDSTLEIVFGPKAGHWFQWRGRAGVHDKAVLYGVTFDVTDQRQAEVRVRESEARYRTLFEDMSEGYCLGELRRDDTGKAIDWRYLLMNPALEKHTGMNVASSTGRWFEELFPGQDRSYWLSVFQEVVDTQTPKAFEDYWPPIDRWLGGTASPASDGRYTIFFQDVTERKRAELALRESEEKYRTLFERMEEGFAILERIGMGEGERRDFRYVLTNPAWSRHTGYASSEGRTVLQLTPGMDSFIFDKFDEALRTGQSQLFETQISTRRLWLHAEAFPAGPPNQVAVIFSNVTERKHAEAVLRESEERQTFLLKLSDRLRAEPDADALANGALQMLLDHLVVDRCYIAEFHMEDNWAEYTHQVGNQRIPPMPGGIRLSGFPDSMRIAAERSLVVDDLHTVAYLSDTDKQHLESVGHQAFVAAFLRRGEKRLVWVLVAASANARHWTAGEIAFVEEVGERTWVAVQREKAEEALRQSEEKYRNLFNSIDEGVTTFEVLFDEEGRAVDWIILENNPALTRITGLPPSIVGKRASEVYSALEPYWVETFGRVAKTGEPIRTENYVRELNRWFDCFASRIGGEGSNRLVGVYNDITDRKRAEKALRESEERQTFLLELSDVLRPLSEPAEIQTKAMKMLGAYLKVSRAQYYEAEPDGEHVFTHGGYSGDLPTFVGHLKMDDFGPHVKQALDEGRTLFDNDAQINPLLTQDEVAVYNAIGVRAYLGVPLAKNHRLVAILGIHDANPRVWSFQEISIVEGVAERTWAAVERARAEAALHASEARLTAAFETVPVGISVIDPAGRSVLSNSEFRRFLPTGIIPSQDPGHHSRWRAWDAQGALLNPEDFPGSRAMRGERVVPGQEMLYTDDDGREVWTSVATVPIRDEHGEVTGQACVISDVDKEKRLTDRLRSSEERQAFLLKLSDALRPLADAAEIQSETTRLLGEHLGLDRCYYFETDYETGEYIIHRDFKRDSLRSLVGRHSIQQWPDMTAALSRGEMLVVHDYADSPDIPPEERPPTENLDIGAIVIVPLVKHGSLVACMSAIQTVPRKWKDGEVSLVADVAERTWAAVERARAEVAQRESEERFRLFVENVREYALVQTDFESIVTSWNPGAERLFGYISTEIVGKPFSMLLPEKDRHEGIISREMAKLSSGERVTDAHMVQRKDGSTFWAEWITEPVLDEAGELRGTAKVMRDETERQQADLFVRNSLAEKEELLKEVHHRVKNNLQVITSLLNLQADQITDKQTIIAFDEARNRVASIASIHELLYRSTSLAAIHLADYAREFSPNLVNFYGMQNRIAVEVVGDGAKLELERAVPYGLLLNELLSNALKHAFPGERYGSIRISFLEKDENVCLRVTDDGIGLPESFNLEESTSLGLKLVRRLARQLRGRVNFENCKTGTHIEVQFPIMKP